MAHLTLPLPLAIPTYLAILLVSLTVYVLALRAMHSAVRTGAEGMAHKAGRVIDADGRRGRVEVEGEIWNAVAAEPLRQGERIEVVGFGDGLTLRVRRAGPQPGARRGPPSGAPPGTTMAAPTRSSGHPRGGCRARRRRRRR